jgi:hypothetical protein
VSDKDIIKVWDVEIRAEIGQLRDHTLIKNGKIIDLKEFRFAD